MALGGLIQSFWKLDNSDFVNKLRAGEKEATSQASRINKVYSNVQRDIGNSLKTIGSAFAVTKIAQFFGDAIKSASNLQESTNKVAQVFKDASPAVLDFASKAAKNIGISNVAARDAAATFGIFGQSAGLAGADLAGFATKLVGLSSDLASFYNTSPADAIRGIASALRGESEPIRAFGVLLNEITLRTEGVKLGLIATTREALTPQQRVLAAYNVILDQTKFAQGDFARTSHLLANQMRITGASFEDTKASIGDALLPTATQFFGVVQTVGLPALQGLGKAVAGVITAIAPFILVLGEVLKFIGDLPGPVLAGAAAFGAFLLLRGPMASFFLGLIDGFQTVAIQSMYARDNISGATGVMGKAGAAAKGLGGVLLGAFGGGIGLAITAVVTGLGFLFSAMSNATDSTEEHDAAVDALVDTLDAETQAITSSTRAKIVDQLESDGMLRILEDLGVSTSDYVDAIISMGSEQDAVTGQLKDAATAAIEGTEAYKNMKPALDAAGIGARDLVEALASGDTAKISAAFDAYTVSLTDANTVQSSFNANVPGKNFVEMTNQAGPAVQALLTLSGTTGVLNDAVAEGARESAAFGSALDGTNGKIDDTGSAAGDAAEEVKPFGAALKESSDNATAARDSLDFLTNKLQQMGGGVEAAAAFQRDFDQAVRDSIQGVSDYAEAQDNVERANLKAQEAALKLQETQANLGKSQEEGGTTAADLANAELDLSAAQRDQESAARGVSEASDDQAEKYQDVTDKARDSANQAYANRAATGDLEGAVKQASAAMQVQRDRFIAAQVAAGMEEQAAIDLANKLHLIPGDIETAYTSPGSEVAEQRALSVDAAVRGIPGNKTITIGVDDQATATATGIQRVINSITGKTVTIQTERREIVFGTVMATPYVGGKFMATADAGLRVLNNRGFSQKQMGAGMGILWGEGKIRGPEWYISSLASQRERNRKLLMDAARTLFPGEPWFPKRRFAAGGMIDVPSYGVQTMPAPNVTVMGGQMGESRVILEVRGDKSNPLVAWLETIVDNAITKNDDKTGFALARRR